MKSFKETPQNRKLVEEKFIVEYESELYDITDFMRKHPGGVNTLNGNNRKNIEEKFEGVEHSIAAKYLLKEYKLKNRLDKNNNVTGLDDSMEVFRRRRVIPERKSPSKSNKALITSHDYST